MCIWFILSAEGYCFDKKTSSALSRYIMGVYYEDLKQFDQAIQEYKKAAKIDRETSVIHLNLASSYLKSNDIPKAIDELNTAVSLDPDAIEPHALLALLYTSQNKQGLASQEYELALKSASKLSPENLDIHNSLGLVYLQQKKYKEALETYRLIVKLSPLDAQAHFYLGSIHNELKDLEQMESEIKKALQIKPDFPQALNYLGYIYADKNIKLDEAQNLIKKALEFEPDNGAYIDSLGWVYFRKGKLPEALKELERASALIDDPVVFDHLGEAYLKMGDKEKAKLNWEKSLKLDPKQDVVKKKLEEVNK